MKRFITSTACVAALFTAGSARAQTAPAPAAPAPRGAVVLDSPERVRQVCLATRPASRVLFTGDPAAQGEARAAFDNERVAALERLYRVTVPGRTIAFGPYDERAGRLPIDPSSTPRAMHGVVTLAWAGGDMPSFELGAKEAKQLAQSARSGTASANVFFELAEDLGAPCTGSVAAEVFTISARPVAFELQDGMGRTLARAETPLADRHREALGGYSGVPTAAIGPVEAEGSDATAISRKLATATDPLRRCYVRRLDEKPAAGGTVVIGVAVERGGKVQAVNFIADALGDPALRTCVEESVRALSFSGVSGLPTLFRVPVELKLLPRETKKPR